MGCKRAAGPKNSTLGHHEQAPHRQLQLACTNDSVLSTNSSARCSVVSSTLCSALCCACSSAAHSSRSAVTRPAIAASGAAARRQSAALAAESF